MISRLVSGLRSLRFRLKIAGCNRFSTEVTSSGFLGGSLDNCVYAHNAKLTVCLASGCGSIHCEQSLLKVQPSGLLIRNFSVYKSLR